MDWEVDIKVPVNGRVRTSEIVLRSGADILTTDRVDMMSEQDRKRFCRLVAAKVGEETDTVKQKVEERWHDLYRQHEQAAATATDPDPEAEVEDVDERAERLLAEMPADVRQEAHDRLCGSGLVKGVVADIAALGVAGEKKLTATIYLIGTSRLLARPSAGRVKGPSASGKSYIIDQVARLFPFEALLHATQMTPKALYHMPSGSLKHRWIVAGERSRKEDDDTAEATRALREMLSSGRLSKLMPVKADHGMETVHIHQEGPIAYVESTTLSIVFDEDENRCLSLFTDEREQQTQAILDRLGQDRAGGAHHNVVDRIILMHHAMQRMLRRREIVIPYAPRLAELLPAQRVEARRAFPHLLSMIEASAFLHQYRRQWDHEDRIIAEESDYRLAANLLVEPMGRLLRGGLPSSAQRFYRRLRDWFGDDSFTSSDARNREATSRSAVHGWLAELHLAGALEQLEESRGRRPATWKLTGADPAGVNDHILPTCAQMFASTE
jgi:hypothetical protein